MEYEELEIIWLAATIFFGFGQALVAIILSLAPQKIDDVISYFDWILVPLKYVIALGFVALFFAIVMTWVYLSCKLFSPIELITCLVISGFGIASFISLRFLISKIMQAKVRP